MRNSTRVNRLNRTANLLETVDKERFNMRNWATQGSACKANLTCGAAACALGWEASQPRAHRAGLRLCLDLTGIPEPLFTDANGANHTGFSAAANYYGITLDESEYLFCPHLYPTLDSKKYVVIRRIRKLAKQYQEKT